MLEQLVEEARRRQAAERERLEKEVRVAQRIQVGLLPRRFEVAGLSMAAALFRSAPVGGDYYDVIPLEDGCFISMGSVSGDGLATGLAMLMLQSVVSGLARSNPDDPPSAILPYVDAVLSENIRQRMARDERAGLTLLRYRANGRLALAGTRAGFLLCTRAGRTSGRPPSGTWSDSIAPRSQASSHRDRGPDDRDALYELSEGDSFVLYTGGQHDGAHFDVLARALERVRQEPAEEMAKILGSEMSRANAGRPVDVALLVAKYEGPRSGARGSA
jgi:sigma-B regulation protein RsbU (phosphoserine phosphatase)